MPWSLRSKSSKDYNTIQFPVYNDCFSLVYTNGRPFSFRYEIPSASAEWDDAEKQVANSTTGKASTVSVKTAKAVKRKAGETAAEIYEQEMSKSSSGSKKNKKNKK